MPGTINKYWIQIIILTGLLISGVTTNKSVFQYKEEKIREAVLDELKLHPKATLIDIYKNFFQGAFGPAHMIDNPHSVVEYIKEELKDSSAYDTVLYQKVGINNSFVRVNLSLIKDSTISLEKLAETFIKTANHCKQPSLNLWYKEWHFIISIIEKMNLSLANFDEDKIFLDNLFNKGQMVVHHSDIFIKRYNPHYRLISEKYINYIKLYE